jgi:hypothetical protein
MVANYFTGNSVPGSVFQTIIYSIFEKAAEIKLNKNYLLKFNIK